MIRLESPGSLVHIMAHSFEEKPLFVDDKDKSEFISRFEKALVKSGYICYTWALMDNHYHLFLRTSEKPMSKLMRGLNGGYAVYYNKRHGKHGPLFRNRFKSSLCQDQNYAAQLVRYINLNPLRARLVTSLEQLKDYTWCGHGFLMGNNDALGKSFQKREECLRRFGENEEEALKSYIDFLIKSCGEKSEIAGQLSKVEAAEISGSCKGWPTVIGDPEFVTKIMNKYKDVIHRTHRKADYPHVLETTAQKVCQEYKITLKELKKRGRKNNRAFARAVFCYRLHMQELIPLSVIAGFLGTTISPIAILVQNGAAICESLP
jgi:REP element-mobilizing transposase RayT